MYIRLSVWQGLSQAMNRSYTSLATYRALRLSPRVPPATPSDSKFIKVTTIINVGLSSILAAVALWLSSVYHSSEERSSNVEMLHNLQREKIAAQVQCVEIKPKLLIWSKDFNTDRDGSILDAIRYYLKTCRDSGNPAPSGLIERIITNIKVKGLRISDAFIGDLRSYAITRTNSIVLIDDRVAAAAELNQISNIVKMPKSDAAAATGASRDEFPVYAAAKAIAQDPATQPIATALGATDQPRDQQAFARTVLAAQNVARRAVGIFPMTWDEALAEHARAYAAVMARTGRFEHAEQPMGPGREGENLFMGSAGAYSYAEMVGLWVAEQRYFTNRSMPDISTTGHWQDVGHYTQVVWRGTTRVGCALATGGGQDYLVCRYSPPGNVTGLRAF